MSEPVVIVPYDERWPALYEAERGRIVAALGPRALAVEHCGSTAVPGLAAKPIVDVLLGLSTWPMPQVGIAAVCGLGYEHHGDGGIPGREYFHRGSPRSFQIHAVIHGGEFWRTHVLFRDRLRADPALACEYEALKRTLAIEFRDDRIAYTDAKAPFIEGVLAREEER